MTMTLLFDDVAAETAPAAAPRQTFVRHAAAAVAGWFAARQAARARRIALASLMDMDRHRLTDLGITPQDVAEALSRRTTI